MTSGSAFLSQLDEEYRNGTPTGIDSSPFLSQLETEYKEGMLSKARSGELPALSSVRQFEITPEMHRQAMSRLATQAPYVRPEDTLSAAEPPATDMKEAIGEGVMSVWRGVANGINGLLKPSSRETETLKWLATLDDAQVRDAVMSGQIDDSYRRYVMLPQAERQAAIQRTLAGQEQYENAVNAATDIINSEPQNTGGWLSQTINKGLEMAPGVLANVGLYSTLGTPAWIAQNTLRGNAAAREQVFNDQIAQGKSVPEALAQANSLGWNAADMATRGAADAATMAAFGATPNMYGGISPVLQRMINVAKGAGASGLGAAGENVIGNAWKGQDVDWAGAAKAGAGAAAATGLFGLFNMALNAGKIHGEHKTWRTIRDFNNIVKDYGVTPLSPDTSLRDAAEFTENIITSGQLPADKAMEMLTRLGLTPEQAAAQVQRLSRQGSLEGPDIGATDFRGQYTDTVMSEYDANAQTPRALPKGGAPGATRDETWARGNNLWNIVKGGQQTQGTEFKKLADTFMEKYGINLMGQKPQTQPNVSGIPTGSENPNNSTRSTPEPMSQFQKDILGIEDEPEKPKGALSQAIEEAKAAETKSNHRSPHELVPNEAKPTKDWFDAHVITGVIGRPQPEPEAKPGAQVTPQPAKTIPEGAKLKGADFTVHYEGSVGPRDYDIRVTPWEGSKKGVRRLYLDELQDGRKHKPVGYYDIAKDKFVKKKDNFFTDEVEKEFRKHLSDFFEAKQGEAQGSALPEPQVTDTPKGDVVVPPVREEEEKAGAGAGKSPSMVLADRVAEHIGIIKTGDTTTHPSKIDTQDLKALADKAFGGTMAEGTYSIKDAYDAMEMGVNKAIQNDKIAPSDDINDIARDLDKLGIIENSLPTQANRTETQNEFQQFSTPPRIAYIANWLSGVGEGDVVLEPSAGVGGLAVFAKNAGAEVVLNEFEPKREAKLREMHLGRVFNQNAEHLDDILPDDVKPTKVIMNPPFSSTAGRMKGKKNNTHNAEAHVKQALARLEDGGRLVAILGKGMNDDAPAFRDFWREIKSRYNVRANVLLNGQEYKKYGTTFGNVIVVIDKNGPTPEGGTVTGSFDTVADMVTQKLIDVRKSAPKPGNKAEATKPNVVEHSNDPRFAGDNDEVNVGGDEAKYIGVGGGEQLIPKDADLKKDFTKSSKAVIRQALTEAVDKSGGAYTPIADVRRKLNEQGISDSEIDDEIKALRDEDVIYPVRDADSGRNPEDYPLGFTDENGFHMDGLKAGEKYKKPKAEAKAETKAEPAKTKRQTMFHGTRHIIEGGFNLDKINTGEGAQAEGWGTYLAGVREVAEDYRLSGGSGYTSYPVGKNGEIYKYNVETKKWTSGDKELNEWQSEILSKAIKEIEREKARKKDITLSEAIEVVRRDYKAQEKKYGQFANHEVYEQIYRYIDILPDVITTVSTEENPGNLYTVEGPGNEDLLDWDAPLGEQPEKVKRAIVESGINLGDTERGGKFYKALSSKLGNDKAASIWLKDHGISGTRYFDGYSRATGKGTHNFVIWDVDTLKIIGVEGPAAKAAKAPKTETEPKTESEPTVKIERKTEEERREERRAAETDNAGEDEEEDNLNVYDDYKPSRIKIKGAKHHPADLVESTAMASVSMPEVTYSPHLPENIINEGLLSEAQLEAVIYAGQSFEKKDAKGVRRGFFIGDGTGLGKGREISGVITDQMRQGHGKGKAVWVSNNKDLFPDAQRDWKGIGNNPEDVFAQFDKSIKPNAKLKQDKGICFTLYSQLRSAPRLNQLKDWLGEDFDGVIALDECHNANNALDVKGERGTKKASQQALGIQELVKAFPNARVLYVSATGATEVRNLAMLDRLGLWGEGTPFPDKKDFVDKIESGGIAAMEIAARDMKAMGVFLARSVSKRAGQYGGPEDVTFSRLTHNLTPHQIAIYDKIAEAWRITYQNMEKAVDVCGGGKAPRSAFYGAHQRCMGQVITAFKTPAMIESIKKDLQEGNSVVVQLTQTNEAMTARALGKLGDGDTLDDLDVSPKETLLQFLEKSFPVDKVEEYTDDDGNVHTRPVLDSDGNPVQSKEAIRMRDELMSDIASISFPETPLDMIINALGAENVAEVTGRKERIVKNAKGERVREARNDAKSASEVADFNDGKRHVLIFSEKGGTGSSYHAGREFKNQEKRIHYLLQPGWRADKAIQGLGRTHRSNEAHKPHYVLVETDIAAEARFMSTIARKIAQTGALTMGERKSASNGLFDERDNLESVHAKDALKKFFSFLSRGAYADLGEPKKIIEQLGYDAKKFRWGNVPEVPPITQFLNRLFLLDFDVQQKLFKHFEDAIDVEVAKATQDGTLDHGTEKIKADKVKILQEKVVYTAPETGAETRYLELEIYNKQRPNDMYSLKEAGYNEFYKNRDGNVVAARKTKREESVPGGEIKRVYLLKSVDPEYRGETKALDNPAFYTKLSENEARDLWDKQSAELPEYHVEKKHMIVGALLPIWDKLSGDNPYIQRVTMSDGTSYLGRVFANREIGLTLARLHVDYKGENITPEEMFKRLDKLGTTATLANDWKLKTVMVNGDKRIEVIGADFTWHDTLKNAGCIIELTGGYKKRVFIPQGIKQAEAMGRILDMSPVMSIKARDILDEAADVINENIPDDVTSRLNIVHPWFADMAMAEENPFVETAEGAMSVSADPEVNERARASEEGVKPLTSWDKVSASLRQFAHGLRGDFPELAVKESVSGVDLKPARELLRKLNREMGAQTQKAVKLLEGLLKPLSAREYDTFRWAWIMLDLKYQKSDMPDSLLPYGWTDGQFREDFDRWMARAEKMPKVKHAIESMEEITADMAEKLSDVFRAIGWHSAAERFKNPHYFHHVVLEFANVAASLNAKHNPGKAPDRRSWLKRRRGSSKDISANFIQVTGEYLTQAFQDIASCEMLKQIKDEYNIIEQVKRTAFVANEEAIKDQLAEAAKALNDITDDEARESAEAQFRRTFNQKQAKALSRLFMLAKNGDLPEGAFSDVVEAMETARSIEELPDGLRKRFNRYLGWLAGLDDESAGSLTARGYFKGVVDKKKAIKAELGDEYLDWRDLVPDGYTVWDPFNNPLVFSVNTIPEKIMQLAEKENLKDIHVAMADLVKMKVIGGHRQMWVIPAELAASLDEMGEKKTRGLAGHLGRGLSTLWKKNVLFNPWRLFKYNVRNFTGDFDAAVAGNPRILAYLPRAVGELTGLFFNGKAATGDLRDFQERGGALTAESMQELYDWKGMRAFRHLAPKEKEKLLKRLGHIGSGYMEWAEKLTQWRESWLRYAAYLHFLDDMKKNGGMPTVWGASMPEEVMALKDIRDRAFKMANELLGAYDQVSKSGKSAREWVIPFYSWKEVNFKRVFQMFRNAAAGRSWIEAELNKILGGGGGGKGPNDPTRGKAASGGGDDRFHWTSLLGYAMRTPTIALRMAAILATNFWFWGIMYLYNNTRHSDEEQSLPPDIQNRPHIVTGSDPLTGDVYYFDRIGALPDFLENFGLDQFVTDLRQIWNGQKTWGDFLTQIPKGIISTGWNAISPLVKMPTEWGLGRTGFPDVFKPRAIRDSIDYLASGLALKWPVSAIRSLLEDKAGPSFWSMDHLRDFGRYTAHPKLEAYYYILDLKRQYQENVLGKTFDGFTSTKRGQALGQAKTAMRYGDFKKAQRWIDKYYELDGTLQGFKTSVKALDPLAGLSNAEKGDFEDWLSEQDKRYLKMADQYYDEMSDALYDALAGTE